MDRYKLTIAYDGTDYYGWQVQPNFPSIAQTMQKVFERTFDQKITVLGASRTDAGVHALGQVAKIDTDLSIDTLTLQRAWNNALPPDIVIRNLEHTTREFHPFYNIESKTYHYNFFLKRPLPFVQRYGWFYPYDVELNLIQEGLNIFVGTHDFRAFCTGEGFEDTVCTIYQVSLEWNEQLQSHRIIISGSRFMRHMVRRIVGAVLSAATKNDITFKEVRDTLASKNPDNRLPTAAPKGLILDEIRYK